MNRIEYTSKGVRVFLATLLIYFYGFFVWDSLILGLAVLGMVLMILQFRRMRKSIRKVDGLHVSPEKFMVSVIAGEKVSKIIKIESSSNLVSRISVDLLNFVVKPDRLKKGENFIELVHSPVLAGVKELKEIKLEITDNYDLYRYEITLLVNYRFTAYPRVFPAAAHAFNTLGEMGTRLLGGQPTRDIGSGVEYAETREYVPGDHLRRFDWKAYAKTTIPMVKDYYSDGGGGTSLVFDNTVDNPISLEELNHAFLKLVLSLTQTENQLQISILTDQGLLNYELDRFNTLLVATQIALQGNIREFIEYYALINPLASQASFIKKALTLQVPSTKKLLDFSQTIIISSLTKNSNRLLHFIQKSNAYQTELLIPTRSWIWQNKLQQSNSIYESQIKLINRIERNGVTVFYSLNNILNRMDASESQLRTHAIRDVY